MGKFKIQTPDGRDWFHVEETVKPMRLNERDTLLGLPIVFTDEERKELRLELGDFKEYIDVELLISPDGTRMIVPASKLTDEQIEALRQWMERHAKTGG